ncbi:MAG TPA: hypothetical protein VKB04_01980 [Anaerolineales bacterium]|nr:hypothetical protein [Anaerolineales bacterium]
MKRILLILLTSTAILTSCVSQPGVKPVSTSTPQPAVTATLIPPTLAARFIDLKSGGFSLAVQPELDFETDDYSINLSDKGGELIISLNGKPYIASIYTLESFLGKYIVEVAARGGSFQQSDPYEISIDGMSGIGIDLTGNFLTDPMAGKAVAISPGKDFIIFGLGMSNLGTHKNGWVESGSAIFEALIASIKFNEEV